MASYARTFLSVTCLLLGLLTSAARAGDVSESTGVILAESPAVSASAGVNQVSMLPAEPFFAGQATELRDFLRSWFAQGARAAATIGEAILPVAEPGLQFEVDPDAEEVMIGWRFQF